MYGKTKLESYGLLDFWNDPQKFPTTCYSLFQVGQEVIVPYNGKDCEGTIQSITFSPAGQFHLVYFREAQNGIASVGTRESLVQSIPPQLRGSKPIGSDATQLFDLGDNAYAIGEKVYLDAEEVKIYGITYTSGLNFIYQVVDRKGDIKVGITEDMLSST